LGAALQADLRGTLRNFGLKVGIAGATKLEAPIKELVNELPDLAYWLNRCLLSDGPFVSRLLSCITACWPLYGMMTCAGRLMTVPGVGPVVALTYRHRRYACSLSQIQVRRGSVWAHLRSTRSGGNPSSTRGWNGVLGGTMGEFACPLGPADNSRQGRPKDRSTSSSNPMWKGLCAYSVEKHEPASDIDAAASGRSESA
jgi:hypothetical protein